MNTMTETDAVGQAIAYGLGETKSAWGKDQATAAMGHLTKLFQAGQLDAESFGKAAGRLGNHSATRQHLEKHGILTPTPDALANAINESLEKLASARIAAMKELDKKQ